MTKNERCAESSAQEEKIQEIRRLVKEIRSYDDVLFMYEGDRIDLEMNKQELWDLLQKLQYCKGGN